MISLYSTLRGEEIELHTKPLNKGGEGAIYKLVNDNYRVAKIYHTTKANRDRREKLSIMVSNPPVRFVAGKPIDLAWPIDILQNKAGKFAGFLMPRIRDAPHEYRFLLNPSHRVRNDVPWKWGNALSVVTSLTKVIQKLHQHNYIVGDLNPDNILVTRDYSVTLVDVDSFQVKKPNGKDYYRCTVGKPEYTPPELLGRNLSEVDREVASDNFALSVLIFQMLMEGYSPFSGTPIGIHEKSITGNINEYCISHGIFPYVENSNVKRPPNAPLLEWLPLELEILFRRCFLDGHAIRESRPSANEWASALIVVATKLRDCGHYVRPGISECPWCHREQGNSVSRNTTIPAAKQASFAARTTVPVQIKSSKSSLSSILVIIGVIGSIIGFSIYKQSVQSPPASISIPQRQVKSTYEICSQANNGNRQSIALILQMASTGDSDAQYCYGVMSINGLIIPHNAQEGKLHLTNAAMKGNVAAASFLGQAYAKGVDIELDCEKAKFYIEKAIALGSIKDIGNLGVFYQRGCGQAKNEKLALVYFKEASYHGDKYAMYNLANAYYYGIGVIKDNVLALEWSKESEKQGNARAHELTLIITKDIQQQFRQ